MTYQVLARKWRPRRFDELVGQGHVVRALINALDRDRLHHAFLFTGTRGVGKTTIARILAKSLNCEQGVTSRPCGTCRTCTEIDAGHFVDLIEVDAASRTKVDDTRELLDNVQYAPTRGRYKVYLIDEVHMLSGHSFNALLKTLEEPPPHVKFLLATTDPQKLPVTVLSRCLQFNLKRLAAEQIAAQLEKILGAEQIAFDAPSLALLAQAADGSMRDALSLLDQAIAYAGGKIAEPEVREMLGTIDQNVIARILIALGAGDAQALLAAVADVAEHNGDFDAVLRELLLELHRVSLAQVAPGALSPGEMEAVAVHARAFSPEDVQLCYQIGLAGRRDLPLAPDARTGLEMTLLRMLAFKPAGATEMVSSRPVPAATESVPTGPRATAASPQAAPAVPAVARGIGTALDWRQTVGDLKITGLVRELANNTTLAATDGSLLVLELDPACANLHNKERVEALRQALIARLGQDVRLEIRQGNPTMATPAKERQREQDERQQAAVEAIGSDPNVDALKEHFNARVNLASIRPKT